MSIYLSTIKQTLGGSLRSNRRQFWLFLLQAYLVLIPFVILDDLLGKTQWLPRIYLFAMLPVVIALMGRRLHDTGRSVGWLLLWFIPVFGWLYLFLMMIEPGDNYVNEYGEIPQ